MPRKLTPSHADEVGIRRPRVNYSRAQNLYAKETCSTRGGLAWSTAFSVWKLPTPLLLERVQV